MKMNENELKMKMSAAEMSRRPCCIISRVGPLRAKRAEQFLATMALNYLQIHFRIFVVTFLQSYKKLYNLLCFTNCFHKLETSRPMTNFLSPPLFGNPCCELVFGVSESRSKENILGQRSKNSPLCSFRIPP